MSVLETDRLRLQWLTHDDAGFIFQLYNDAAFLQYIGDRGVRSLDDASVHLDRGPLDSYRRFGFGLYRVERKSDQRSIGLCGLLKRDTLDDVDLGFAYLPEFRRQGYAVEAAGGVLQHAHDACALRRVVAITSPDNAGSIAVLTRLGFQFERMCALAADTAEVKLFGLAL